MSRRRHLVPLSEYVLTPSRLTVRLTEISLNAAYSPVIAWSLLSKISSTVACDTGLRAELPEKMTSVSESPRSRLAELSPMTQRTASMMLDLPQPLGPTTPVMLVGRWSVVGSTKDLKPESLIVDRRMRRSFGPCVRGAKPCDAVMRKLLRNIRQVIDLTAGRGENASLAGEYSEGGREIARGLTSGGRAPPSGATLGRASPPQME